MVLSQFPWVPPGTSRRRPRRCRCAPVRLSRGKLREYRLQGSAKLARCLGFERTCGAGKWAHAWRDRLPERLAQANGFSALIVEVFGPELGAHAWSAVGLAELPYGGGCRNRSGSRDRAKGARHIGTERTVAAERTAQALGLSYAATRASCSTHHK